MKHAISTFIILHTQYGKGRIIFPQISQNSDKVKDV